LRRIARLLFACAFINYTPQAIDFVYRTIHAQTRCTNSAFYADNSRIILALARV